MRYFRFKPLPDITVTELAQFVARHPMSGAVPHTVLGELPASAIRHFQERYDLPAEREVRPAQTQGWWRRLVWSR